MYRAVFQISGDSLYSRSTAGTDTRLRLWCNDHCDLLHISGSQQENVIEYVQSAVGIQEQVETNNDRFIITKDCLQPSAGDYIKPYLVSNNCLLIPPYQYENGTKVVRVLALDSETLTEFYHDISEEYSVIVKSKQELSKVDVESPIISMESILPQLSSRQREVFFTAYENGYFEIPRGTTTAEIGDEIGVNRRTVEDHLRRAQKKLADSLIEYL
ncbi:helix-turn-helix domain-containing protein [Halopenitus persicus]|uniref:HTH luxR-type domain-containing protein n=1 Tax=Halopenitus persicus TaxID=1048396 RepID=A0A1H3LBS6_9EURY|nr:helix-turn-helix domain-containing protein [Halopenitus persicus]SDY61629.1 hypothetical protein SAMN05216564_10712 [Halopenitus persicus]